MKRVTGLVVMLFALGAAGESIQAQGRGNGQAKKTTTQAAKPTTKQTAKADTRAAKTTAKAAKPAAKADARVARAETKAVKAETKAARKSGTTPISTIVTPTTPTTHTVKNPKLETRLVSSFSHSDFGFHSGIRISSFGFTYQSRSFHSRSIG